MSGGLGRACAAPGCLSCRAWAGGVLQGRAGSLSSAALGQAVDASGVDELLFAHLLLQEAL